MSARQCSRCPRNRTTSSVMSDRPTNFAISWAMSASSAQRVGLAARARALVEPRLQGRPSPAVGCAATRSNRSPSGVAAHRGRSADTCLQRCAWHRARRAPHPQCSRPARAEQRQVGVRSSVVRSRIASACGKRRRSPGVIAPAIALLPRAARARHRAPSGTSSFSSTSSGGGAALPARRRRPRRGRAPPRCWTSVAVSSRAAAIDGGMRSCKIEEPVVRPT